MKSLRYLIPLAIFGVLVVFLWRGLSLNPREVPSPLIDKAAPAFALPQLHDPAKTLAKRDLAGKVWLLNVWASWCPSCRDEHPTLIDIAKSGIVPIYGLNYKDQREDALAWLKRFGDPYVTSGSDLEGRVAIDFGVYGAPETFLIDRQGQIRYKHIGPVTPKVWAEVLLPKVRQLSP